MKKLYVLICSFVFAVTYAQQMQEPTYDTNGLWRNIETPTTESAVETTSPSSETFTDVRALSEINSLDGQGYPWISGDALRLYYIVNVSGGSQILYSERADFDSDFTAPVAVMTDLPITPISLWISSDELEVYVCSSSSIIYYLHRNSVSEAFNTPILVTLTGGSAGFFSGISLTPDQNEMYAYTSSPGAIARYVRTDVATFSNTGTLPFGSGIGISPGQLSKDGLHFIASTGVSQSRTLKLISRESTGDLFDGLQAELIGGLDDPNFLSHVQASVSNNMEWIAFIRNTDDTWNSNRLYIARNAALSVIGTDRENQQIAIYPNPSNGIIHFNWNHTADATLEIFNSIGQIILKQSMSDRVDLTQFQAGIYCVKITAPDFSETKKIILE